jgi:hypothetical protein
MRWILFCVCLGACGGDPIEQSCDGEALPSCRPFEYAIAESATADPGMLEVGDPLSEIVFHVTLRTCGAQAPDPHRVAVSAVSEGGPGGLDGGAGGTRVTMLLELADDGSTFGDPTAKDGVVDATVSTPFMSSLVSPNADIRLRFTPRSRSCSGEYVEIPYRTGDLWMP